MFLRMGIYKLIQMYLVCLGRQPRLILHIVGDSVCSTTLRSLIFFIENTNSLLFFVLISFYFKHLVRFKIGNIELWKKLFTLKNMFFFRLSFSGYYRLLFGITK